MFIRSFYLSRYLSTSGSCASGLGEIAWDGVDPGGSTKGLFPTSTPHPLAHSAPLAADEHCLLLCFSPSWWLWLVLVLCCWSLLLAFVFCAQGHLHAWVFFCLSVVVVGGCLLKLWGFCPPRVLVFFPWAFGWLCWRLSCGSCLLALWGFCCLLPVVQWLSAASAFGWCCVFALGLLPHIIVWGSCF